MLDLEFKSDISNTKGGKRLIDFIKAKYKESFFKAKNEIDEKERLKALDLMAFLDLIILNIKEQENGK